MWKQSLRYFDEEDLSGRMAWTWARSAHAMLTTTLTTAMAFMANGASPIPPIAVFGIFTALLVLPTPHIFMKTNYRTKRAIQVGTHHQPINLDKIADA